MGVRALFGDIVRGHRRRLGLSQRELADKSGVTERGLRRIESGQIAAPRPVTVRLLADAFGLTAGDREEFYAAAHPPPSRRPEPVSPVPAQLPADVAGFVGRFGSLRQLDALLDGAADRPRAVVVTAVAGAPGVGKTSLAVHWAHRVRHRFPDGQLYINLRGYDPSGAVMAPAEAIRRFLDALAVPPERIPADPGAQADLYRTLLADRRMLVVLDNARDPNQVRPLLPGSPGCLVLVTSRNRLTSLVAAEGAHALPLDLLTHDESRDLLARRLGNTRVGAEPGEVDEIITSSARLPLALAIVAANAATTPNLSLAVLADQLRDSQARLDVLSTGDDTPATDARAVFSWSYRALARDTARLFRLLGLHPGPDVSVAAAASLAALPVDRVRPLLKQLVGANLLIEHGPGRYAFHDLLHAYAADLARATDPDDQRRAATGRMLDQYLHTAYAAARLIHPTRDPIALAPLRPGVTEEDLTDFRGALAWFTIERPVLLAVIEHTATGFDTHIWQLAWALDSFLNWQGHWHDRVATQQAAVAAAGRQADPAVQALTRRSLAQAYAQAGRVDDAYAYLLTALDLYTQVGDLAGQAHTHHGLSFIHDAQGRRGDAFDHARRALDLFRAAGHRRGQAHALNAIGWDHAHLGQYQEALDACQRALALHEELDDRSGQAGTWDSIGYVHHHLGQYGRAIACYRRAVDLYRDLGDRFYEADTLAHLGDAQLAGGATDTARDTYRHALTILEQLDHPNADKVRAKLLAL
jgi:tetratricopeptide (TPR) repeat protein/transcriptional regulator with XRE-family HTH domain